MGCAAIACAPRSRPAPKPPEETTPSRPADRFDYFYQRTDARFNLADFYKPDPEHELDLPAAVAPLIVIERAQPDSDAVDRPEGESPRLVLLYAESEAHFGPVLRRQIIFQWQPPDGRPQAKVGSSADSAAGRIAVRFTLTELGAPMIVEFLPGDPSGSADPAILFVSRSLEDAARRQYGGPLPHRRYACEPAIDSVPEVVIAGVLEDPPVVSGPYLYFADEGQTLTTVICRCSPSQVGDFVGNEYYTLEPLANGDSAGGSLSFPDPSPLTEFLRLPDALP